MTACAIVFFASQKSVCFAEATGKVKAPTAYIRQSADKSSEPVGSTASGKTVTIVSQTTDASGYVWYEVVVEADKTGYIRSDLVDVDSSSGTIPTSSAPTQSSEQPAAPTASGAEIMPETGMDAQYATIKVRSANVRSGAAKTKGWICTLSENTQVVVSGQTEGSDGTWYYITFTGTDGGEKTGYVRSDMVNLGEMVPVEAPVEEPQEQPTETETPEETPTVSQDYEVRYEFDENAGEDAWFIYDWTDPDPEKGTKQRLDQVLTAAHANSLNNAADAETVSKQRIVIIVLIAVVIILAVVMTIMVFKLRDAYYEAYEDDDDEEEEDEEEDRRRKEKRRDAGSDTRRSEARRSEGGRDGARSERSARSREEREEPVRRKAAAREERQSAPRRRAEEQDKRMPAREVSYEEEASAPVRSAPKKKAKNFMIDDDDFEFEFLNMKSKDKDI